jgi:hypothetical protein
MSCIYPSYISQVYAYSHLIPWIVPLFLFAFSIRKDKEGNWGFELVVYLYSALLSWGALLVYALQMSFNVLRGDPYCPDQMSFAYPSMEAFYTGAAVTYIVLFTYLWNAPLSEMYWVIVIAILGGPPLLFVWYTYNTLYEVIVSSLMGIFITVGFLVAVRFFWLEHLNMLVKQRPWSWLAAINTLSEE